MQVFVYEYFTGGGTGASPFQKPSCLLAEAAAMAKGVTADFAALGSVRVISTRDARLPPLHSAECEVLLVDGDGNDLEAIGRLAHESDWTLLIAPETSGVLWELARFVESSGGRLLSPGSEFIEIAANKQATAEALLCAGVPAPRGGVLLARERRPPGIPFPAVIKPLDGCGSRDVRLISDCRELDRQCRETTWRLEEFIRGLPASVGVLCGPDRFWSLPACEQRLSADGHFAYLGGRLPLLEDLDRRARRLAVRAVEALPATIGYVGVDLVLGDAADGHGDRVIEVNPRLTTSYVGLRAGARGNLAAAMLAVAGGDEPVLRFAGEPLEFSSSGEVFLVE